MLPSLNGALMSSVLRMRERRRSEARRSRSDGTGIAIRLRWGPCGRERDHEVSAEIMRRARK